MRVLAGGLQAFGGAVMACAVFAAEPRATQLAVRAVALWGMSLMIRDRRW